MNKLFRNKKVAMTASLVLGVMMLSIPTFAELNSKTGYDSLKDSVKSTAEVLTNKASNFTSEISVTVKDNDKVLFSSTTKSKTDSLKNATEIFETTKILDSEKTIYHYLDSQYSISSGASDIYYISEYTNPRGYRVVRENPLEQDNAADIEKIVDAVLAGLKDNVKVTENNEGKLEFTGNVSENQVPTLINTLSSYFFKTKFVGDRNMAEENNLPKITNDIYIKNVSGKASANNQGVLENLFAMATLSGKEKDGTAHDLSVEMLVDISDINKTAVNFPELTGKKVEKNVIQNNPIVADVSNFVGNYENDIVVKENGKFVKIGERHVTIAHGGLNTIEGRYYEEYIGDYGKNRKPEDFTFSASTDQNQNIKESFRFTYTSKAGKKENGNIFLNQIDGNINFYIPIIQMNDSEIYNGTLIRSYDK